MQHTDVFEKFKVIVRGVVNGEIIGDWNQEVIEAMVNKSRDEPYVIIAVIGSDGLCWFDENVRAVSNGSRWIPMTDYIDLLKGGSNWPN